MPKTQTGPRRLYSIAQTQHDLGGIAKASVYRLINAGKLKRVRVGGRAFVTDESLSAYVARLSAAAAAEKSVSQK